MSDFGEISTNIIGPIVLIVIAAVVVDRVFAPDPSGLSRLVIYLFTPFLVLDGLANSALTAGEAGQLVATAAIVSCVIGVAAWWLARLSRFDRKLESSFVLTAVLINAGNYGIPLNHFAFGEAGADRAIIFFVVTVLVSNTVGIFLASRGSVSTRRALLNVAWAPLPYAAAIGLALNVADVEMPVPVARAVSTLGDAAIPAMLAILGIQLSRASIKGQIKPIMLASGMRLVISPLIAFALVLLLGLSGLTRQVAIVQAAMPTAVISGVLATEFGGDVDFVTGVILVSTVASMVTLSVILSILM
jgi:predicted permease